MMQYSSASIELDIKVFRSIWKDHKIRQICILDAVIKKHPSWQLWLSQRSCWVHLVLIPSGSDVGKCVISNKVAKCIC